VKEVQAQRRARAETQSPGAGVLELEAGRDFEKLCDRVGKDPAQALTAEALDIMLGLLAKARKAREQIQRMIAMGFAQDQRWLGLFEQFPGLSKWSHCRG
jgi:hypothetical protein